MNFSLLHDMVDRRINSRSVLIQTTVKDYLDLVRYAYDERGNIDGQRPIVKTTTALRIRNRMRDDFEKGAILPPVVVGIVTNAVLIDQPGILNLQMVEQTLSSLPPESVSIIDGMQRTTIFRENPQLSDRPLRVELWLVKETTSLIYRMLVLNTGQVPWNLRRQIEVVNSSLLAEIQQRLSVELAGFRAPGHLTRMPPYYKLHKLDDHSRRTSPGEFQANEVVEMYVAFGLKKEKIDTETVLADVFSRLDMVDAISNVNFLPAFTQVFASMIELDYAFSLYKPEGRKDAEYFEGRNVFDHLPATVGFIVAAAQKIYGRPGGSNKDLAAQERALEQIVTKCRSTTAKLATLSMSDMEEFLDFGTLNELFTQPASKHGDFARELYREAFRVFLDDPEINTMTPSWRAR